MIYARPQANFISEFIVTCDLSEYLAVKDIRGRRRCELRRVVVNTYDA
jgi:hypothetical protein